MDVTLALMLWFCVCSQEKQRELYRQELLEIERKAQQAISVDLNSRDLSAGDSGVDNRLQEEFMLEQSEAGKFRDSSPVLTGGQG